MKTETKNLAPRLLILITTPSLSEKAAALFNDDGVPLQYTIMHGQGTASSEILDMLGRGSTDKTVTLGVMPKTFAEDILKKLHRELKMGTVNSGIAFTVPVTAANNFVIRILNSMTEESDIPQERKDDISMPEIKYSMIVTLVNQGFSDAVMDAARAAGAGGGTIIHTRQAFNEDTVKHWGIEVHDEKEIVLIIADTENKTSIMQAIVEKCGIKTDAKGIVLSLPVDSVMGLGER